MTANGRRPCAQRRSLPDDLSQPWSANLQKSIRTNNFHNLAVSHHSQRLSLFRISTEGRLPVPIPQHCLIWPPPLSPYTLLQNNHRGHITYIVHHTLLTIFRPFLCTPWGCLRSFEKSKICSPSERKVTSRCIFAYLEPLFPWRPLVLGWPCSLSPIRPWARSLKQRVWLTGTRSSKVWMHASTHTRTQLESCGWDGEYESEVVVVCQGCARGGWLTVCQGWVAASAIPGHTLIPHLLPPPTPHLRAVPLPSNSPPPLCGRVHSPGPANFIA